MPEIEEITEEVEKTATVAQDEAAAGEPAEKAAVAESSTASDENESEDGGALSIVRDVVNKGEGGSESAASSAKAETDANAEAGASGEPSERDNEDYSDVPFNKHPRFRELIAERNGLREDAQRYKNVEQFIESHGLEGKEVADLIEIGGLIKTNPVAAWERMKPVVEQVVRAAGEALPDDLLAKVRDGALTREAALEVSRARAARQSMDTRQQWEQQRSQSERQRAVQASIDNTVGSWVEARKARDPNYASKEPLLQREIAFLQSTEGRPNTPEGVRAQLEKAYRAVNENFTAPQARQQKPAIKPVTGGQQVNGSSAPKIESAMDAVNAVIARRAG